MVYFSIHLSLNYTFTTATRRLFLVKAKSIRHSKFQNNINHRSTKSSQLLPAIARRRRIQEKETNKNGIKTGLFKTPFLLAFCYIWIASIVIRTSDVISHVRQSTSNDVDVSNLIVVRYLLMLLKFYVLLSL